ncbi:MAG TPA: flagellar hook-associated protein FlgK [Syntrophobacteraceae bacterium]|nr:flagellar hook-associated protein FlgK [Syntrophobacteraceae bacterium]
MSGLMVTLETAKRTLLTCQVCVQTASHNIANAESKDYARQRVAQETSTPYQVRDTWLGAGARIRSVVQVRNEFIERRLTAAVSKEADYRTRSTQLSLIEATWADDGEQGLSQALGAFWDAWEALNRNPDGISQKALVEEAVQSLVDRVRDAYRGMTEIAVGIESEAKSGVTKVNGLLEAVAAYNEQIMKAESTGQPANDLRDLRYEKVQDLAELIPVRWDEEDNGTLTLRVTDYGSDITLVSAGDFGSLVYDDANHRVTYRDYQGTAVPDDPTLQNELSGGKLAGLLSVYNLAGNQHDLSFVQANPDAAELTYLDRLNAFAAALITEVNAIHRQGGGSVVFDDSVLGEDFKASDLAVDANFVVNSAQALEIADLQSHRFSGLPGESNLGNATFLEYLGRIQEQVGLDRQDSLSWADFQATLLNRLQEEQQSVSGVSIDEEMVDLIKFQQIYQAAAKVISHAAEMLDTAIEMVG